MTPSVGRQWLSGARCVMIHVECGSSSHVTMEEHRLSRKYCSWMVSRAPPTRQTIMLGLWRSSVAHRTWATTTTHKMHTNRTFHKSAHTGLFLIAYSLSHHSSSPQNLLEEKVRGAVPLAFSSNGFSEGDERPSSHNCRYQNSICGIKTPQSYIWS